jgi:predicted Rossmann fold flavoprotein
MGDSKHIVVVGGGAAGFFAAIRCAELKPALRVTLLERGGDFLEKVRISGGGRCNVCPSEFIPRELVKYYPRGGKALLGPFNTFCSGDTVGWFESRGVALKIEPDGRMFPVTDDAETVVTCLRTSAERARIHMQAKTNVVALHPVDGRWEVELVRGEKLIADRVLLAPGSSKAIWMMLEKLGHTIEPPVPSLFTFNIKDPRIEGLQGLSVPHARVRVPNTTLETEGPLLITHWGMSGPAILKLSAWGARVLAAANYQFECEVNWLGEGKVEQALEKIRQEKTTQARKKVQGKNPFELPNRLWNALSAAANISDHINWADLSKPQMQALAQELAAGKFQANGKSTFKDEFVTCGGVRLDEVNFKTMESKLLPGLFFAGEVLDIDALTGGYNFQAAWTTGWLAGTGLAESRPDSDRVH